MASVPQREQLADTLKPLFPKEKEQSRLSRSPDREGERVKVSESRTLARERKESEREHEKERVDSTVKGGRPQEGEGVQTKRTFLEEVEGSISG